MPERSSPAASQGRCRVSTHVSPVTDVRTPWQHGVLARPVWESESAREVWRAWVAMVCGGLCGRPPTLAQIIPLGVLRTCTRALAHDHGCGRPSLSLPWNCCLSME
jgi:hypothetical protein